MKKKENTKNIIIIILSMTAIFIINTLIVIAIITIDSLIPAEKVSGINNYNKNHYLNKYSGDLDSNLSIFPEKTTNMIDATFTSSIKTNLFDSDGFIILSTTYNEDNFKKEVDRLSKLTMTISDCKNKSYTNYVKYNTKDYSLPAYITIDGFGHTYEYALINQNTKKITYVYLAYPDTINSEYRKYLKKNKKEYLKEDTLNKYSMYNHSFDKGKTYMEYNDC